MEEITKLVLASHNQGKIREIRELLEPFKIEVLSAADLNLDEPVETEDTFIGNALLKARAATVATNLPALADDSGLEVHELGGAPGIYSARWAINSEAADDSRDFYYAMNKVKTELEAKNTNNFRANFVCVLAVVWPNGEEKYFEGKVFGNLVFPPRGNNGFGYDPIFVADGENETYGEMSSKKKDETNHRAVAFAKMKEALGASRI